MRGWSILAIRNVLIHIYRQQQLKKKKNEISEIFLILLKNLSRKKICKKINYVVLSYSIISINIL